MKTVTKKFLNGNLKGLEITEKTSVPFELGKVYKEWSSKTKYKIIKIEE